MDFDHNKVRRVVNEDRLSSLPDELIHKIMSCIDMKFVVQMCLLSSRWKLLWTSMPYLNFSSEHFDGRFSKFGKFVTHVMSHRNHQIEVASVELVFSWSVCQVIARKIANYAFSHNIQQLTVVNDSPISNHTNCPLCLFSSHSQSLKHFTLRSSPFRRCVTPSTPWDFPALTTLHLSSIMLCNDSTKESVDYFSKCVNLKNLNLENFSLANVKVFDIITPRLTNLRLKWGNRCSVLNLIAPQLEKLTVIDCWFKYLNAPSGLSSLYYSGSHSHRPLQLCKDRFHSLNKVTICLYYHDCLQYKEADARKTINMLQELHSARYLTVNVGIVECISSFPDLLLHHPSPFSNLICLTIDSRLKKDGCQEKMSTEARNFFLENSPNAALFWE